MRRISCKTSAIICCGGLFGGGIGCACVFSTWASALPTIKKIFDLIIVCIDEVFFEVVCVDELGLKLVLVTT
jgi:hypothetical protein